MLILMVLLNRELQNPFTHYEKDRSDETGQSFVICR